jgi:pimeloyl-ACP methyl ester carboxylesterase
MKQIYGRQVFHLLGFILVAFAFVPGLASADCGNINTTDTFGQTESVPIADCDNPFGETENFSYTAVLFIAEQVVVDGAELAIATSSQVSGSYEFDAGRNFALYPFKLFQKQEQDYVEIVASRGPGFTLDALPTGTYVGVFTYEVAPVLSQNQPSWWQRIRSWFSPTPVFASPFFGKEVLVLEFTVVEPEPEPPAGASSVLFLPGIQASRLYTDGVLGSENRLWEPNRDNDVEKLAMDETGQTINSIYTEDVLDEIFTARNIYQGFLDLLDDLKDDGLIVDFTPFAYDWRYDVFTVATEPVQYPNGEEKLLLEEVKRLASESHTGKVTIVGHSNGGLVAKALMVAYQDNELDGLVEKVIMVGTPQLGTPKAVGSILHGLEQALIFEFLVTQNTARETTQYMPGAYGLLPSRTYFDSVDSEIITTDGSSLAVPISSYDNLGNYDNFFDFLIDAKGTRSEVTNLTQPISLSETLLAQTVKNQADIDAWVAPEDVQVFEVAGTGIETISSFYYREFSCKDTNPFCALVPFIKPVARLSTAGDGTVIYDSASAYEESKFHFKVDLASESEGILNKDIEHANMTESDAIKIFLESALLYPQLTDTLVAKEFSSISRTYTIIGVHSPVTITVKNAKGERVGAVNGEIREEMPNSSYFEFAGSKYVIVPDSEEIEVLLEGEAAGRYSLTIEELTSSGSQNLLQEIIGATSTPEMRASFSCVDGICEVITVDYDGDSTIDVQFDWSGNYQILHQEEVVETIVVESRSIGSTGTRIRPPSSQMGEVAGIATSISEEDLQRMWRQLLEIQKTIEQLKDFYLIK